VTYTSNIRTLLVTWPGPYELVQLLVLIAVIVLAVVLVRFLKKRK